jgi:predicted amidophosphoribosyltransferase
MSSQAARRLPPRLLDVVTSGATASAAAAVLKRAGARRVDVLALAIVSDAHS